MPLFNIQYSIHSPTIIMRLLDTSTSTTLKEFIAYQIPPYAILSHRWGDEELAFQDLDRIDELIQQKSGYDKVKRFCERAAHDGYPYA